MKAFVLFTFIRKISFRLLFDRVGRHKSSISNEGTFVKFHASKISASLMYETNACKCDPISQCLQGDRKE